MRSDGPGLTRIAAQGALIATGSGLLVAAGEGHVGSLPATGALAMLALLHVAMFAALHESGHRTAFASRVLNDRVSWFAALFTLYTPSLFRAFHFAHHRHTHQVGLDPEITYARRPMPEPTSHLAIFLVYVTGLPLVGVKLSWLLAAALPLGRLSDDLLFFVPAAQRARVAFEARLVLLAYVAIVAVGALALPGLLGFFAVQVLGHAALTAFISAEHSGLPHGGSILERTRTTRAWAPIRWLLWNMPYHAEHHALPAVPFHALPALHAELAADLRHVNAGYVPYHAANLAWLVGASARSPEGRAD